MLGNFHTALLEEEEKVDGLADLNVQLSSLMSIMPKNGTVSASLSKVGFQHLCKIEVANSQASFSEEVLDDRAESAIERAMYNVKHRMQGLGLRRVSIGMDGSSYVSLVNLLGSHA